jgi:Uncharacterised protein family UPF0547
MEYSYCKNCGKMTGHKRHLGWGTFFGSVVTLGTSLAAVPFYPKRCIICGNEKEEERQFTITASDLQFDDNDNDEQVRDLDSTATKVCPQCAEEVKAAAKICRFCRYEFPQTEIAQQRKPKGRIPCTIGSCIGIINENGVCGVCGNPYVPKPPQIEVNRQKKAVDRIPCSDGSCIGIINENGVCGVCGKHS